ncbi:TlpA disulfide reductase family protein [Sphingomonas sp.]|uniref:TlpA family protein disulfide reductase n=1 Tax=Sphingomonas sp. TaxID=28214 RepID=UPI0025F07AA1|nr:TlpA disulfide reductase family protein [Sphingomonas sp.]
MRRIALLPVMLAVVATGGCNRQEPAAPQATAPAEVAPAAAPEPSVAVNMDHKGKSAPKAPFEDLAADNAEKTIADFKGKPVLVNLWATWCVPCVKELPTLAKLGAEAPGGLQVVAVSQDMQGAKVVLPFLKDKGIAIHPYHDRDNALMLALGEASLPVSILFDAEGKEVWRISGDLDWSGAKAKALLAQAGA